MAIIYNETSEKLPSDKITMILYADHLILIANNEIQIKVIIKVLSVVIYKKGLQINNQRIFHFDILAENSPDEL